MGSSKQSSAQSPGAVHFRLANADDLDQLVSIENQCFSNDKLSRRSMRHWIKAQHGIFLVVELDGVMAGYALVWCHKGTRLARLYSLAVLPSFRGKGLAVELLKAVERSAAEQGRLFMRLEVASNNASAISLYERLGYRVFGRYEDYYDDHDSALRMQKTIQRFVGEASPHRVPWYQQTTEFTCGPAALMMAMASLDDSISLNQGLELDLWREATSIFMTSGHGGCHPLGLALAAARRGFKTQVTLNSVEVPFIEGVRSAHKKEVLTVVHRQFVERCKADPLVNFTNKDLEQSQIIQWLDRGMAVLVLISTYRLDGRKTPHWVTVTGFDNNCIYLHDPDTGDQDQLAIDCQHVPIAREDFAAMTVFGSSRLRTALALKKQK